uniref:ST8 alpha-N-acetyl-neuraminide alpha-2,8-sialyltransferase 1 n=1 Tax=Ficedula albicollis TaxID=59894 RepID=A0A803W2H0_FICAL
MAGLAWKWPRTRLPMGASALGVFVLCWLYVFPVYRLPDEKEIVQGVLLQQGKAWRRNQTAVALFRKLLEECCDPGQLFAMTKMNSPMGKNLWFDGEFLYSVTIDNATYSLFPQATPFQLPLKKCSVVGNGGILKKSGCGKQIDQADFVMRCNLPPLSSEYSKDVGSKTQLVTANPSIIQKRFQNLLWSRKAFVDSVKVYNHSYIYMPAFSMKTGTGPSLRVYYTLEDFGAKQAVLFANPNFLRDIGKFWKSKECRFPLVDKLPEEVTASPPPTTFLTQPHNWRQELGASNNSGDFKLNKMSDLPFWGTLRKIFTGLQGVGKGLFSHTSLPCGEITVHSLESFFLHYYAHTIKRDSGREN